MKHIFQLQIGDLIKLKKDVPKYRMVSGWKWPNEICLYPKIRNIKVEGNIIIENLGEGVVTLKKDDNLFIVKFVDQNSETAKDLDMAPIHHHYVLEVLFKDKFYKTTITKETLIEYFEII